MNTIFDNTGIQNELDRIAEIAGFLWDKNWAERNAGNISVNLTALVERGITEAPAFTPVMKLEEPLPFIAGNIFYMTGSGTRMRDVYTDPLDFGAIIRITQDGGGYEIVSEKNIQPTSELPTHLAIHNDFRKRGSSYDVVLHTHPTELIALTHNKRFLDPVHLTRMLWSMIPETRIIVPKGIGIVPYILPGTMALARATMTQLHKHDVVLWEKHGIVAVGEDIIECFDAIDTLSKSAQIYLSARTAGFEPEGLTDEQLDELATAYKL